MGGPLNNRNAETHGIHSWLIIGKLPKGASYVRRVINRMKTELQAAVVEVKGELTVPDAALCQSAARHEGVVLLATRWLRERGNDMSDSDRLAYMRQISTGTDARDRAVKALGLRRSERAGFLPAAWSDDEPDDPADAQHAAGGPPAASDDSAAAGPPPDATGGEQGTQAADPGDDQAGDQQTDRTGMDLAETEFVE